MLASSPISCVRFQEAAIEEFQVCLESIWGLTLRLWSESKHEDSNEEERDNAKSNSELVKRVTRHNC